MRVVFFGTGEFSCQCLEALLSSHHKVVAVVCQPDKEAGRGKKLLSPPVKLLAREHGIEVFQFEKVRRDGVEDLKALNADVFAVAAYGQILSQEILDIALPINVHGSLLPKYRGASPIQTAILNGDKETGITIMKMAYEVDSGDIILQEKIAIEENDTSQSLFRKMGALGGGLLVKALDLIEEKKATFTPQDHTKATFTKMLKKEDALLDFNKKASTLVNQIRAFNPNPVCYFLYKGEKYKVYFAKAVEADEGLRPGDIFDTDRRLLIKCGEGALEIEELQAPSSKRLMIRDYLNGRTFEHINILQ